MVTKIVKKSYQIPYDSVSQIIHSNR